MKNRNVLRGLMCTASIGAVSLAAQANLIVNGSFENNPAGAGWTFTGDCGTAAASVYNGKGGTGIVAADGLNFVTFNSGDTTPDGILSQSFVTVAGTPYQLSFAFGVFSNQGSSQSLTVELLSSTNGLLASMSVTDSSPGNVGNLFGTHSLNFIAADGNTTVSFLDNAANVTPNTDSFIDAVSVSAIPEPSSLVLLGLGGLALLRRRRRMSSTAI